MVFEFVKTWPHPLQRIRNIACEKYLKKWKDSSYLNSNIQILYDNSSLFEKYYYTLIFFYLPM